MIRKQQLTSAGITIAAALTLVTAGLAQSDVRRQAAGSTVPKVTVLSNVQAADPIEFEMTRLVAENMKQLGLDVEHRAMPWAQQADLVWYRRNDWQMTAWRMVGRPERMDPDEFTMNLFHSSTAKDGYNFVGFNNRAYDRIAQEQRRIADPKKRRLVVFEAQNLIAQKVPYVFVANPRLPYAYRADVWEPGSVVDAKGIGIKNFWTWVQARPVGKQKRFVLNTGDVVQAINPLFISGAADSWITELVWDRLMFVGPDGLPKPRAAQSVTWLDKTHVRVKLRPGMKWSDGRPVTAKDVVFSFEAPASGEAPMYKPFVSKIVSVRATNASTVLFTLTEPYAAFEMNSLAKINLIPEHVWAPIIRDLQSKKENAESYQETRPVGSGPYRFSSAKLSEEIVLSANRDHYWAPKASGWILRIIPNAESALQQLKTGEINFLSEWEGDPTVLVSAAKSDRRLRWVATTEVGMRFFALNNRSAPFNDVAFRRAIAYVVPKQAIIRNIFKSFATPATSFVSPALTFWYNPRVPTYQYSVSKARSVLKAAGYTWDGQGRLVAPGS